MRLRSSGAASSAAPHSDNRRSAPFVAGKSLRFGGVALLLALAVGALTWSVRQTDWYRDRQYARLPLPALEKELQAHLKPLGNDLQKAHDHLLLYHLGRRLNQQERFSEADPLLRQAVGLEPNAARLRDEWTKALLGSGLTTAAFGQLKQFAGAHPDSPEAHFLLGKFYFTQHSMRRAAEEMEAVLQRQPDHAEAWAYLAGARDALGEATPALEAIQKAVALRSDANDYLLLASLQARANQPQQAREAFEKAVSLAPKLAVAHREFANWLLASGSEADRQQAETEARQAIALDEKDAEAHLILGRLLLLQKNPQAALEPLQKAAALAPHNPQPASGLAQAYRALGQGREAGLWQQRYESRQKVAAEIKAVFEALRADPDSPKLHLRMARLSAQTGDVAGTVRHHARARGVAIDSPVALTPAANDLVEFGFAKEALPLAQRANSVADANPSAQEALGNVYLGLNRPDLAGKEFNKVVSSEPGRLPELKKRMAQYYARRAANPTPGEKRFQQARRMLQSQVGPRRISPEIRKLAEEAVQLEPTNLEFLHFLLRIQIGQRDNPKAIQTARQILSVAPKDARAHALLAVLLVESADSEEKLAEVAYHLEEAAYDPAVTATRRYGLGLLALQRKQGPEAVRELREAARLDPNSEVVFYKLAQAEKLNGNPVGAEEAMKQFREAQSMKRKASELLSDIAQQPHRAELYDKAAAYFDSLGEAEQAEAIRAARRRIVKR